MAAVGYYSIAFNANGGSGAPGTLTGSTEQIPGTNTYTASVTLPSSKPSRNYYTFLGWGSSSGATSASHAAGSTMNVNGGSVINITLWAVWKRNTAYVYYNANGGTGAPATQSHNAGSSITLSATKPTRNGYKFLGWATTSSATTAQYQPSTSYNLYVTTTLYAVWKTAASSLSAPNGNLGDALTITITREVNTYTDTITWAFGTQSGTIATKTSAGSVSWTPSVSLASEFPNSASGPCVLTCTTYNGDTLIGTTTKTITLTVPQSLAPTVSVSYADTIAQCLTWGLLVQSRSKLAFSITASGQQGATIASYSTSVNGTSYNSASFTTDVLLYNGTNSYTVTVTDSRGLQTVSTGTFSVVAYSNPSLTLTLCDRNDSDPDQVDIGFDFSVASVSSNNDAKYRLDYKLKSASTWTNGTVQNLGAYSGSISDLIANLDGGDEWDIRINVIDSFQTASVESEVGVAGNILLNSRHNGGLGLLMKSQADNQLDIGKPTVHHGAVLEQFGSTVGQHKTSGNYAKVLTFSTNVTVSANLLPPMVDGTYSGNGVQAVVSGGVATLSGTTTASGNAIIIPLSKAVVVPDNSYFHLFNSVANGSASPSFELSTSAGTTNIAPSFNPANRIFAVPSNRFGVTIDRVRFWLGNGVTLSGTFNPMLAMSSTAIPFEPYADASDLNIDNPLTMEFIRSADTSPTRLTIGFNRDYTLNSFTSDNSVDAYLHNLATATWDLYIGKSNSSDSVEILDFHNPWSNSDMTVEWDDTSISTLPTGATQASIASIPNSYGDLKGTGEHLYESPSSISLASGATKTVGSITLSKGVWLLIGMAQFNSNATGMRKAYFANSSDSATDLGAIYKDTQRAVDGDATQCSVVAYYANTASSTTLYFVATQNSGSSITTTGRLMAIKIA